jgi:hypothetical protein
LGGGHRVTLSKAQAAAILTGSEKKAKLETQHIEVTVNDGAKAADGPVE